jgi:5,5'-dehydrodivanillate O-demethylase oxygenase subunit
MLSEEKNQILTRVGADSPMGQLLRRYWHPIAARSELREKKVMPVRLLGEDLVLFLTSAGTCGLIERQCTHCGADLNHGWADRDGLWCVNHGWAFGPDGLCTVQAFEQASPPDGFREKAAFRSYPTEKLGGLIWGYLGPRPAPLLPDFESFHWDRGFVEIIISSLPCNWFQCHENGVDPVHFEWLHANWTSVHNSPGEPRYGPRHEAIDFAEFEFGFICGREIRPDNSTIAGPMLWTEKVAEGGILCMWPYTLMTGDTVEWRVPVDDVTTLNVTRQYSPLPQDMPTLQQQEPPYWYGPIHDEETGCFITTHPLNQDFAAWVGQGIIADRGHERLGRTDKGIILLRRRYLKEVDSVMRGHDPPGTIRSPDANVNIQLPIHNKARYVYGVSRQKLQQDFVRKRGYGYAPDGFPSVQAGRPETIRQLYKKAIGGSLIKDITANR